jgi:lamin tail-like protein
LPFEFFMQSRKYFLRAFFFLFLLTCLLTGLVGTVRIPAKAAPNLANPLDVVINEVAWAGTIKSPFDEWIELYNPTAANIDLTNWRIEAADGDPLIPLSGVIPANGYLLLERGSQNVTNVPGIVYSSGLLSDSGETLYLLDDTSSVIDVANSNGAAWPTVSSSPNFPSMERVGVIADSDFAWVTFDSTTFTAKDAGGNDIYGTPGSANSQPGVTPTFTSTATLTSTPTSTGTATATNTPSSTSTPTRTPTRTATGPAPASNIVISEFRAIGTGGETDEFIELYNPTSSSVSIGGWVIKTSGACNTIITKIFTIPATVTLAAGQHYLIGGTAYTGSGIAAADQTASLNIATTGGIALFLPDEITTIDEVGLCSSTFFHEGTYLTSLLTTTNRSYDRRSSISGACSDTNNNRTDFFLRSPSEPQNSTVVGKCGSPTPTPTITGTATHGPPPTKFRTSTPIPPPPPPLVAINEFVPRPGHDWNNDGEINIGDEYIELLNHGVIDVNLSGYRLDDEANIGSTPYGLPSVVLKPGQRMVFYESQTGIHLDDGGDGVRLIKPNGQLGDAYNYSVVQYPDQSYCRLPDNGGLDDWNQNCAPTPGLRNAPRNGSENLPIVSGDDNSCPIGDTLPLDFMIAECEPFGNNIWSRLYWDAKGWLGEKILPNTNGQWDVYGD